ncbi:MAG: GH3 auxin-responsive promoter family protein [Candidatus Brockarchaeota archaeon]|nr:GH3 auxin-responsive promoter family protein [Candidatus Brockarchaeota archaeon]
MIDEGKELWDKYCGFLYQDFQRQIEYNREKTEAYFKKIKNTRLLEALGARDAEDIREIPVTTYDDYLFLRVFEERISRLEATTPKNRGETLADYYMRIGRVAAEPITEYLPGEFQSCVKTSGTTAQSKWVLWTRLFREAYSEIGISPMVMACSERTGDTRLRLGDSLLNMGAPPPYFSGWSLHFLCELFQFKVYPPPEVIDKTSDIRRRIWMVLEKIDRMKEKIALIGTTAPLLFLLVKYVMDRRSFYREYYETLDMGATKIYMFLKSIHAELFWEPKDIRDVFPVKGLISAGFDSKMYIELFKRTWGIEPLNLYGASEIGFPMYGTVEDRYNMVPDLRTGFFEFMDVKSGEVFEIDELKKGNSYSLIITPFGGCVIRYRIGDIFRVEHLRDDGAPVFAFEGREGYSFDIYGYFRIDERLATRVMIKSGLTSSEDWCFAKIMEPNEKVCVLMEKERDYSEEAAAGMIFKALLDESEDFRNFIRDFKIRNPTEVIKVEYLERGAFKRYSHSRLKMGLPYGQVKPLKVIPTQKMEIFETLRGM